MSQAPLSDAEVNFIEATLKAVAPHYPGFEQTAVIRNFERLCAQAREANALRSRLDDAKWLTTVAEGDRDAAQAEAEGLRSAIIAYLDPTLGGTVQTLLDAVKGNAEGTAPGVKV